MTSRYILHNNVNQDMWNTALWQKLYFCSEELLYTCSSCHISVAQLHIIHSPRSWTPALPASSFSFLFQYKTTQKQYTHITQQSKSFHTSDLPCLLCGTKEQRTHLCTNHNTIIRLIHLPVSLTLAVGASLLLPDTTRKHHTHIRQMIISLTSTFGFATSSKPC